MEYTHKQSKRERKRQANLFHDLFHISSDSSLSSKSKSSLRLSLRLSKKVQKKKGINEIKKRDYLTKLYEKKKLKEKSLSKKVKTPFDRKVDKTCWPIELRKISKIQKKPHERKKQKPSYKSLRRKKIPKPTLISKACRKQSSTITSKRLTSFGESFVKRGQQYFTTTHFLYEPVTPQMLIDVLKDPEHLKTGATIDMIIEKLRTLKVDLNPSQERLKSEVLQKLLCTVKLGLVIENGGFYKIAENYRNKSLNRKKVLAFWELWYRRMSDLKSDDEDYY